MFWYSLLTLVACLLACSAQHPLSTLKLPPGFNISVYAFKNLTTPRQMAVMKVNKATIVFTGTISQTKPFVYALIDDESDGINDRILVVKVVNTTYNPGSVAVSPTGDLWIAAVDTIYQCPNAAQVMSFGPGDQIACKVFLKLAKADSQYYFHAQRHMQFNPQKEICIAYGVQCNECLCHEKWCRINCYTNNDPSKPVAQAVGVRNSVGYDWHPTKGDMWFTDNGRDNLNGAAHQDMPDDELNIITTTGENFGYPFCHSQGYGPPYVRTARTSTAIHDPDIGQTKNCSLYTMAQQAIGPHVGALGMKFVRPDNTLFPATFQDTIMVAQHGSWDRDRKIGYRVAAFHLDPNNYPAVQSHQIFVTGWLNNDTQKAWGRPVDVQWLPDGSLLISDDGPASCVYRVTYKQPVVWDPEFTWAVIYPQPVQQGVPSSLTISGADIHYDVGTIAIIVVACVCLLLLVGLVACFKCAEPKSVEATRETQRLQATSEGL